VEVGLFDANHLENERALSIVNVRSTDQQDRLSADHSLYTFAIAYLMQGSDNNNLRNSR